MRKLVLLFVVAVMAQAQGQAFSRILTSSAGKISSPSYPLNYPPNQDCSYGITAPVGSRVTLTFVVFRTEPGLNGCERDYIQIRDENSATSPLMGIYCDVTVQTVVRSFSNSLYVRFVSDSSVTSTGFLATYATAVTVRRLARSAPGLLGEGPPVGLVGVKNLNQTGEVDNLVARSGSSLVI